jgi:hypothetical protein
MTDETDARVQDGTIKDATDFWQLIMDTAYLMEGENRQFEREQLVWCNECLDKWFAAHPEITQESESLEHFAMCAVRHMVGAFSFNDTVGSAHPDFRRRLLRHVADALGADEPRR